MPCLAELLLERRLLRLVELRGGVNSCRPGTAGRPCRRAATHSGSWPSGSRRSGPDRLAPRRLISGALNSAAFAWTVILSVPAVALSTSGRELNQVLGVVVARRISRGQIPLGLARGRSCEHERGDKTGDAAVHPQAQLSDGWTMAKRKSIERAAASRIGSSTERSLSNEVHLRSVTPTLASTTSAVPSSCVALMT